MQGAQRIRINLVKYSSDVKKWGQLLYHSNPVSPHRAVVS
jgi:hypothetical protein